MLLDKRDYFRLGKLSAVRALGGEAYHKLFARAAAGAVSDKAFLGDTLLTEHGSLYTRL